MMKAGDDHRLETTGAYMIRTILAVVGCALFLSGPLTTRPPHSISAQVKQAKIELVQLTSPDSLPHSNWVIQPYFGQ